MKNNFWNPINIFFIFLIIADVIMIFTAGTITAGISLTLGLIVLVILWTVAVNEWTK